jgi:hypothetical protein
LKRSFSDSKPQLNTREIEIVAGNAPSRLKRHSRDAPTAPELASLTRLGTVACTPPEIGDPVIDQLDTGIGQPQLLPTEKAGDVQRSPALGEPRQPCRRTAHYVDPGALPASLAAVTFFAQPSREPQAVARCRPELTNGQFL